MVLWKVAYLCCSMLVNVVLIVPAKLSAQTSVKFEVDSSLRELNDGPTERVSLFLRRAESGLPRTAHVAFDRVRPPRTDMELLGKLADAAELNPGNVSKSGVLHVAVGAAVGGAAVVSGILLFPADEAILVPEAFIPGAVGGAIVGGAIGWIVYRIRR